MIGDALRARSTTAGRIGLWPKALHHTHGRAKALDAIRVCRTMTREFSESAKAVIEEWCHTDGSSGRYVLDGRGQGKSSVAKRLADHFVKSSCGNLVPAASLSPSERVEIVIFRRGCP